MTFFLDHDVPNDIGRVLRLKGHSVQFLADALPGNTDDRSVLRHAVTHKMIVISCNRGDFLRLAEKERHVGIIVLVRRRTRTAECAALLRLLARAGETGLSNNVNFA